MRSWRCSGESWRREDGELDGYYLLIECKLKLDLPLTLIITIMSRADVFSSSAPSSNATSSLPKEEQESLKASIFQRLHPRVYLERFVAENVRPDGRQFAEWRDVSINVGTFP